MTKNLGWISIGIIIFTLITFSVLPVNGFWGTNYLIGGMLLALLTAIFSKKGLGKNLAFVAMAILLILFVLSILGFFGLL